MAEATALKGVTWDHSRGFDPMIATSAEYSRRNPGVTITWDKQPLQAFADRPIAEMADRYDLMVFDHPHVGEASRAGHLLALDGIGRDGELADLAGNSVGASHQSYEFDGNQWGLAIDAATPVAAYRPDLLDEVPSRWSDILDLAHTGKVAFALVPINALMTYFGFARNKGYAVAEGPQLMSSAESAEVLEAMREIVALIDPVCLTLDPIGVYDWMGGSDNAPAYSPLGYGYTNYSREGYCRHPLIFADAPGFGGNGPRGTVIGGAGIAVSARTANQNIAVDYAFWVASTECQRGLYFESGGQPGNAAAWDDDACNAVAMDFFRNTRETLEAAWLRPRYDGYMEFQAAAGDIVHSCIAGGTPVGEAVEQLQSAYEGSLP